MSGRGELGRLVPETNLRSVWPDEARDFTPWLARPENLEVLEDALGLTLEVEGTEHGVGPYRADIVCRDDEGRRVFIENQLEATDHQHLGQLLTYAGGLDGRVMVWIAKRFTDDHRAAIDWLNTNTRDGVEFYAVEIQLWRIGASGLAPRFNVVCRPNAWSRVVDRPENGNTSRHLKFWSTFADYVTERGQPFKTRKPRGRPWNSVAVGRTHVRVTMANRWGGESSLMIYLRGPSKSSYFRQLHDEHQSVVDGVLGKFGEVKWREMPGQKSAIIQVFRKGIVSAEDENEWMSLRAWFCDATISVLRDLKPTLLNLRYEPESPEVVPDESDNHDE